MPGRTFRRGPHVTGETLLLPLWKFDRRAWTVLLALLPGACGSGATEPAGGPPAGVEVELNGALVVRARGTTAEGLLHVHVGQYSGRFTITPVTSGGARLDPAVYVLAAEVGDAAVATFVPVAPGAFEGEIVAHHDGGTTLTLTLLSAESAVVYRSPPIELIATTCEVSNAAASVGAACATSVP